MKKIIALSGLPRAGTTLLCNILAQNPRFYATETSGCLDVLFSIRNQWNNLIEHKASPRPDRLHNVLKATLQAYYEDVDKPVVFSKSRGFLAHIELIENILGEKIKIIVPVRPVPEILASFEKLYRETAKVKSPPAERENYMLFQTIKGRTSYWMRNDQVVGLALNRLEDAIARGYSGRLFFVDFYELTSNPEKTMRQLYNFLGEKYYNHNFNHVEQVTHEDDEVHGFVDLHKIKNKVEPVKRCAEEILGKEIVDFYTRKL